MQRLSIGELSRATGLTVRALRHYQGLGLLAPAEVDPATRYRVYGPEQLERARAIARLQLELERLIGPGHERPNLGFDLAGPDGVTPAHWDGGGER